MFSHSMAGIIWLNCFFSKCSSLSLLTDNMNTLRGCVACFEKREHKGLNIIRVKRKRGLFRLLNVVCQRAVWENAGEMLIEKN